MEIDVVILDELGYVSFSQTGGALLFHLISKLYEHSIVIITTNLTFGDAKLTITLLDPLTHQRLALKLHWANINVLKYQDRVDIDDATATDIVFYRLRKLIVLN